MQHRFIHHNARVIGFILLYVASIFAVLATGPASATSDSTHPMRINTLEKSGLFGYKPSGIALRGYDTVAYFTQGAPARGLDQFSTSWSGATWKFASQAHLELFEADPERYAPQYGGYCAYGVAVGNLVKIEPELWTIVEGKLYLNFNQKLQNKWERDIPGYIRAADQKFEQLLTAS